MKFLKAIILLVVLALISSKIRNRRRHRENKPECNDDKECKANQYCGWHAGNGKPGDAVKCRNKKANNSYCYKLSMCASGKCNIPAGNCVNQY